MAEQQKTEAQTLAAKHGSYYYAHNRKRDENAPADPFACGPVKLRTEKVMKAQRPLIEISKYAWTDDAENKKVKIYLTQDGIAGIKKAQVTLKWKKQRIKLVIRDMEGKDHFLRLSLSHEISDATFKKKANKIIIFLTKRNSFKWYDLKNKDDLLSSDEDDEDDEAEENENVENKLDEDAADTDPAHNSPKNSSESIFAADKEQATEENKPQQENAADMTALD